MPKKHAAGNAAPTASQSRVVGYLPGLTLVILAVATVSMSVALSARTSLLTTGAAVVPLIMLAKMFSPVRYYLRLTAFLLGKCRVPTRL